MTCDHATAIVNWPHDPPVVFDFVKGEVRCAVCGYVYTLSPNDGSRAQ